MKRDFDPTKILKVNIDEVRPNTWNPKEKDTPQFEKVLKSVKEKGLMGAIAVRETNEGYEILDGEQRFTSATKLGYKELYIYNEGVVDDEEAKALTIWWQQQVPFKRHLEYVLITELIEGNEDMILPYSEEEIDEMNQAEIDLDEYFEQVNEDQQPDGMKTFKVVVSDEQYKVIMQGIEKAQSVDRDNISEGRAIELICADYLAN